MNNKGEVQFRVLSLVCLAVVIIASAWVYFSSPGSVLSRNQASFVSPDGLVNQDSKHPTSFGDADDLLELAPPPQALPAGSAVVTGHVSDAITGLPVANADVGISTGKKGIAAVYTTTGADGSYTFSNLADTSYNLSSSRYTVSGTLPLYANVWKLGIPVSGTVVVDFQLDPLPAPGVRPDPCNRARNLIILDYDETYYESWFSDPNSMMYNSPGIHSIAAGGVNATEHWTTYGWSPIDHYQIAVGNYPGWRSPDAPAPVWGQPDGLDTGLWYSGIERFLQESIFDVAKSYGMSTAVIGGNDYPTGHITDANVDLIQLGDNPPDVPITWTVQIENFITAHATNPNGFLIYAPYTMAEGRSVESTSPDVPNSGYQIASAQDDQAVRQLLDWLQANGYMANTTIIATSDEGENDSTPFDNFYGLGSTGRGTTRHVPFAMEGPSVVTGPITYTQVMNMDDVPTNAMIALNLPPPVDSRGYQIPEFFTPLDCGVPTPGPSPTPTRTPTPTSTATTIPTASQPRTIVINEVGWGGTAASSFDEWIELKNNTSTPINLNAWRLSDGNDVDVYILGTIPANGYFLLERTDDTTISDVPADLIYSGNLANTGESLTLLDSQGIVIDTANGDGGGWPGGSGSPDYKSMERIDPSVPDTDANWGTNDGVHRNGLDSLGGPINGTPKQINSVFGQVPTPSRTPSPTLTRTPSMTPLPSATPGPLFLTVVVNEVGWGGTAANSSDEWIELKNNTNLPVNLSGWTLTDGGDINFSLNGSIAADGYFLLERSRDLAISDIPADQIYSGVLSNTGESLTLKDNSGTIVDTANGNGGGWPGGSGSPSYKSMERINPNAPDTDTNWGTNDTVHRNGLDANGNPINGTPKQMNSAALPTPTFTSTATASATRTVIYTPTATATDTASATLTFTYTPRPIPTDTTSATPTLTDTPTATPTAGTTATPSPTLTRTATRSSTPTRTPTPTPGANVIVNGNFESGPGVGWTEFSSGGFEIINTQRPHTGSYSADECGYNLCTEYIQQQITIPAGATLRYWWYMTSQEGSVTAHDFLRVQVYSTGGALLATLKTLSNTNLRNTWTQDTISLAAGAGRTVVLRFTTTTDSLNPTTFYIDDVSVR